MENEIQTRAWLVQVSKAQLYLEQQREAFKAVLSEYRTFGKLPDDPKEASDHGCCLTSKPHT